jgi:hypothetical protein
MDLPIGRRRERSASTVPHRRILSSGGSTRRGAKTPPSSLPLARPVSLNLDTPRAENGADGIAEKRTYCA